MWRRSLILRLWEARDSTAFHVAAWYQLWTEVWEPMCSPIGGWFNRRSGHRGMTVRIPSREDDKSSTCTIFTRRSKEEAPFIE